MGYPIPVPQALIQMTLFLGALTFMYVSARAVGDGEYRYKFLDPLIEDLKLTLLAATGTSVASTPIDLRPVVIRAAWLSSQRHAPSEPQNRVVTGSSSTCARCSPSSAL